MDDSNEHESMLQVAIALVLDERMNGGTRDRRSQIIQCALTQRQSDQSTSQKGSTAAADVAPSTKGAVATTSSDKSAQSEPGVAASAAAGVVPPPPLPSPTKTGAQPGALQAGARVYVEAQSSVGIVDCCCCCFLLLLSVSHDVVCFTTDPQLPWLQPPLLCPV